MLIALTGPSRSGKSHAAKALLPLGFQVVSFATPLKQIAAIMGFDPYIEKEVTNPFWKIAPRQFLQTFGTEVCREFLPQKLPTMNQIWIRLLGKKLSAIFEDPTARVVIDDLRFQDEYDFLCFDLPNSPVPIIVRIGPQHEGTAHASERGGLPCDYILPLRFSGTDVTDLVAEIIAQVQDRSRISITPKDAASARDKKSSSVVLR